MNISDDTNLEQNQFYERYRREELIDLEYVKAIGGWEFVKIIAPLFLKGSRNALSRIIFCEQEKDYQGMKFALHKLMGTANSIGALKIVRTILSLESMIDTEHPLIADEIEKVVQEFEEIEEFLKSLELYEELDAGQAS